jgi:hypothetical protein
MAEGAERAATILRAESLASVLDQRESVLLGDSRKLVQLRRVAEDVHREDPLRPLGQRGFNGGWFQVQRSRVDVCEDGRRSLVEDAVRGGDERERGRNHLVAWPEPRQPNGEVKAGSSTRDRGDVRRGQALCQRQLEAIERWPERQAAGAQHCEDELLLPLPEPGSGKRNLVGQDPGVGAFSA